MLRIDLRNNSAKAKNTSLCTNGNLYENLSFVDLYKKFQDLDQWPVLILQAARYLTFYILVGIPSWSTTSI